MCVAFFLQAEKEPEEARNCPPNFVAENNHDYDQATHQVTYVQKLFTSNTFWNHTNGSVLNELYVDMFYVKYYCNLF